MLSLSKHGPAREYLGVCSNYLAQRTPGTRVNAFVKESKSGFTLPDDPSLPIVMIGPGTGFAPFRGFLQERRALRDAGRTLGPALLFFGCRRPDEDYIYREELAAFAADGIVELYVAFSRDGSAKRYVQHALAERADAVFAALDVGGVVFVCGDGSAMEPQVRETLRGLYRTRSGTDDAAADAWLADLIDRKRYVLDVWASA